MGGNGGLRLKFWGVRGSTPTPQIDNLSYGGNTACIEIRSPDDQVVILDAGSGLRKLGQTLLQESGNSRLSVHFLLTHFHWDHIQGIPFFAPLYRPETDATFYTGQALGSIEEKLQGQMSRPYFPIAFEVLAARRQFAELDDKPFKLADLVIHPFPLNHPQGAVGYRIEAGEKVIVHASDLEHGHPQLDKVLRQYAEGADVLVYDAQFTPEEYESHKGWGHSTWLEATRVAHEARVKTLILFHHDPWHDDQTVFEIVQQARLFFDNTLGATEGWHVCL
jgi:phosphoribosyl 1,2-cyclic phosphodiesterase